MAHNLAPLGAGHYRRPKSNSFLSPLNPSAQVAKRERGNTIDSPISFKPPLPLHLQQQQQQQMQQQQMQQQQMQQYQGQQNYQVQQQSNLPLTAVLQLRRNGTPKRGSKHHYWSLRSSGNTNTHFSIGLSLRNNINQEVLDFCQNCLQPLPPLSPSSVSSPDLSCCARPLRGFVQNDCKIAGSVIECTGDCSLGSICEPLAHLSPDEPRSLSTVPFIPTSSSSSSSSSAAPTLSSSPANASSLANGPGGVSPGSSVPGNSQEDPVQLSGLIPPTVEPGRILKLKVHQHVLVAVTVGLHHFAYDPTITRPSAQPAVTSFPTQRDVTPITINCCMMAKPDVKCGMVKFNNLIGPAVICTAKGISMEKLPASLCGPTTFAPTHPINAPNIAPQISSPSSAPSHSHSFLSHSPSSFHMGPPSFQPGTPPSSFHFSQQLQQQQQSNHANSNHLVHNNNNNNNLTPQQQQHLMNMSNSNNQQSGFSSGVRTPPLSNSGGLSSSPFDSQNNQNSNGGGNGNGNGSGFSNYLSSPFLLPQLIGSSSSSSSSSTQSPSMFQQQHHQQQQQSGMFGSAPSQSFLRQPSTFQEAMMQRHEFSQPDSSFSSGDVFMQQQQQHPQQQQQGQGDWMQDSFSQDDALYFPPAQHNMMDSSVIPHFNNGAGNNNNNNNSGGIPINSSPMQGLIGQSGNNNNGGSGQLSFARPFDHIKPENSWSDSMSRSAPATFSGPGLFDIMQHHQQQQQQQFQQQQQHQFQQQQHQFQQQQNQQQQQPQFSMGFHRTMGNNNGGMGFQNANPNANMGMGMSMGMGLGPGGFGQVTAGFERSTTPTNWSVASPTDSCASTADFEMGPGWNMEMDGGEQAYAANSSADQIDVNQYFNNSMDGGSSTEANYDSDGSSSVMAGPGSTSPFLSHNPTHHHNNNNNSGNMPIGQGSPLHQNQNQNQNSAFGAPRFPFQ